MEQMCEKCFSGCLGLFDADDDNARSFETFNCWPFIDKEE